MAIPLDVNGAVFEYPEDFNENWGVAATGWAQAVTNGMLQMQGGSFPLTADVNFGPNFGLLSKYFETRSTFPATTGTVRLSPADAGIAWRNNAHNANLVLTTDASDRLLYNGNPIATTAGAVTSIIGTANQVIASSPTGAVTLSLPQNIATTSSPTFATATLTASLILKDSALANLTIAAPTTLSAPWTLHLPVDDGLTGQVLSTDGSGNTSWINAAGGGTINSGTANQLAYYAGTGTTLSGNSHLLYNAGLEISETSLTGLLLTRTANGFQGRLAVANGGGSANQIIIQDITNAQIILLYDSSINSISMGTHPLTDVVGGTATGQVITYRQGSEAINGSTANSGGSAGTIQQGTVSTPDLRANAITQVQNSAAGTNSSTNVVATSTVITTTGGTVLLFATLSGNIVETSNVAPIDHVDVWVKNGASGISGMSTHAGIDFTGTQTGIRTVYYSVPMMGMDTPGTGTFTYTLNYAVNGSGTNTISGYQLMAIELKK